MIVNLFRQFIWFIRTLLQLSMCPPDSICNFQASIFLLLLCINYEVSEVSYSHESINASDEKAHADNTN